VTVNNNRKTIIQTIFDFFQKEENKSLIQQLKQSGLQFKSTITSQISTGSQRIIITEKFQEKFQSKTLVMTGSFFRYDRDLLKDTLKKIGAKVSTSVSSRTNYLIAGVKPGGQKIDQATKYKIPIIDEEEIIKLLD